MAQGANGPTDIHMAATGCASEPTFSQQINATQYVQNTTEAAARYANPSAAVAAGYVLASPTGYPVDVLRQPDHRGRQRGRQEDARPQLDRRAGLRPDAGGDRSARRRHVPPAELR